MKISLPPINQEALSQQLWTAGHPAFKARAYVSLRGKQDQVVTIISAYRVPQKSPSSVGVKTAYMQQLRAIQLKALEQTD
jgi:hypothetical protein